MHKLLIALAMLVSSFALADETLASNTVYQLKVVEYPPFIQEVYSNKKSPLLAATKKAFELAKLNYDIEYFADWDTGFDAYNRRQAAVFVADVDTHFKEPAHQWVNTYCQITNSFYAHVQSRISINELEDLKTLRVGAVADRMTGHYEFDRQYMRGKNAEIQIEKFASSEILLLAVQQGWIDVAVLPKQTAETTLFHEFSDTQGHFIERVGDLNNRYLHLLFNLSASKKDVEAVQDGFKQVAGLMSECD